MSYLLCLEVFGLSGGETRDVWTPPRCIIATTTASTTSTTESTTVSE